MVSLWPALEQVSRKSTGKRTSKPKTRTGCGICKTRRVKCDEFKPTCKRCEKFGTICDGYSLPVGKRGLPLVPNRAVARTKILPKSFLQTPEYIEASTIYRFHSGLRFENETERRCFRFYCEETATHITGPVPSLLWPITMPQTSEIEPFVRHALVAIGALAEVSKYKKRLLSHASPSNNLDSTYALKQYHQSLRKIREAVASGDHDLRKLLLASLLIFCVESLQGNFVSAVSHAERGIMLFHQSLYKTKHSTIPCASANCVDKTILGINLMNVYAGLDLYVLFFLDTRSEKIHREILVHLNTHILAMPVSIQNIGDAREFELLIMRRNYHFFKIALKNADMNAPRASLAGDDSAWEGSCCVMSSLICSPGRPSRVLEEEYKTYKMDMMYWAKACSVLFGRIRDSGTHAERILIKTLEMNAKASSIVLMGQFFSSELEYDPLMPDFKEIVSSAESVQPDLFEIAEGSAKFLLGFGVNWPLFVAGVRCRDKAVRNLAISLLGRQEHREGVWDAITLARIAEWVRDMEEKNMGPNGFVEEDQRVFLTGCNMDLQGRKVLVTAMRRALEGLVAMKTLITW